MAEIKWATGVKVQDSEGKTVAVINLANGASIVGYSAEHRVTRREMWVAIDLYIKRASDCGAVAQFYRKEVDKLLTELGVLDE